MNGALVRCDAMCQAIANAYEVDEVKDIRDRAVALEHYSRLAHNVEAERQPGMGKDTPDFYFRGPRKYKNPREIDQKGCLRRRRITSRQPEYPAEGIQEARK